MDTKVILVDLDLTLLRRDGTISDFTLEILRKCQEHGMLVGFSTSRGTTRIQKYADIVHPDIKICNAGACIYLNEKLIHSETFTLEETKKLLSETFRVCGEDAEMIIPREKHRQIQI